jgi:hypothetical protein
MAEILLLDYAGPPPRSSRRSLIATWWRLLCALVIFLLVCAVVTVRTALLIGGVACVLAGTLLLTLGGRRDALTRLARWRARWSDLLRLWIGDIKRPLRALLRRQPPVAQVAS